MYKGSFFTRPVVKIVSSTFLLVILISTFISPTVCSVITQNSYTPYYVDTNADIYNTIDISVTQYADTSGEIPTPNGNFSLYLSKSAEFDARDGGVRLNNGNYYWSFYPYRSNWWEDTSTSTAYTEASYFEVFIAPPFTSRDGHSFNETKTNESSYLREIHLNGNFFLQTNSGFLNKRDFYFYVELNDGTRVPLITSSWDSVASNYLEISLDNVNIPCKDIRGFVYSFKYGGFGGNLTKFEFQLDPSSYLGVFNSIAYEDDIIIDYRQDLNDMKDNIEQQIQDALINNPDIDISALDEWELKFGNWLLFPNEALTYGWFTLMSDMLQLSLTVSIIAVILHGRR